MSAASTLDLHYCALCGAYAYAHSHTGAMGQGDPNQAAQNVAGQVLSGSSLQSAAQQALTAVEQNAQANAASTTSALLAHVGINVTPDQINGAIALYNTVGQAAISSVAAIANGGPVNLGTVAPIVGLALTLTGVGAPVAAAVTAGLGLLSALSNFLNPPPPTCTGWQVGNVCFTGILPYGPSDPRWQTFAQFAADTDLVYPSGYTPPPYSGTTPATQAQNDAQLDGAFPGYRAFFGCEQTAIANVQSAIFAPGFLGFLRAWIGAWQANAELAINGYKSADSYSILAATSLAWNAHHAGPTTTITPQGMVGSDVSIYCAAAAGYIEAGNLSASPPIDATTIDPTSGPTSVSAVLNGYFGTATDHPPLPINTGMSSTQSAALIKAVSAPSAGGPSSGSGTTTGTATKVVAGTAIAGGSAVALWLALGRPGTWSAFKSAWSKIWGSYG